MRIHVLLFAASAPLWGAISFAPLAFEPNRGQSPIASGFLAHEQGFTISLQAGRVELISRGSHIASVLSGARKTAQAEPELPLPGVVNYLRWPAAGTSITGIPTYGRVRYRSVYPGIDVVYYGNAGRAATAGQIEYDFIVAPGADPNKIRMRYEGARSIRIDASGDLVVEAAGGAFHQHKPVIYQEFNSVRHEVAGRFVLRGKTVRFAMARYDRSRPLVIDPALTWATYAGYYYGESLGMTLDSSGNVYVTGYALQDGSGDSDILLTKLAPNGTTALITTHFGGGALAGYVNGGDPDFGQSIAVDSSGNMYVAGGALYVSGYTKFPSDLIYVPKASSNYHAFLVKINSTGTAVLYGHYFGGSGGDYAYGIALDASNSAYIAGVTTSTNLPVTAGAAQSTNAGGSDGFVAKFDGSGNLVYATYLGGAGSDSAYAIAVDSTGNAYVTGSTASSNFPVTGSAYQSRLAGATNTFVTKLAPGNGSLVFSTYLGGSGTDIGFGVAVDSSGAAYVTGQTSSSNFPVSGAYQPAYGGGADDMFITKLNVAGAALAYSTYLGGSDADYGNAITVDSAGNAYVTGGTASTDFPLGNAFQLTNKGSANAVVAGLNSSGAALLFSSYLGGTGTAGTGGDYGSAIASNCAAGLVVAGTTTSTDFPATVGALAGYPGGTFNPFVAAIAAAGGSPLIATGGVVNNSTFSAAPVAPGSIVSIFGSGLALTSEAASAYPLPASLGGSSVAINGNPAPMFFASSGQINIQLPFGIGTGSAIATVTGPCATSAPVAFQVTQAAPYILQSTSGGAVAQNQDLTVNSASNPAKAGSVITVYLTGIGPVDNTVATGAAASAAPLSRATLPSSSIIGGFKTDVQFLGLTPGFAGLAQANLLVPSGLVSGTYALVITIGGTDSNGPNVYVQ